MSSLRSPGLISIALLISTIISFQEMNSITSRVKQNSNYDEVLILPRGEGLQFMSFGYPKVLAHLLWFNTISYFGRHYRTDRNYQWLNHMCNLVTDLDPKAIHAYEFCGLMLTWEANQATQAVALFKKGMLSNQNEWRLPYLKGIAELVFIKNAVSAKEDFVTAAKLPGANAFVARLAAKQLSITDNPDTAINFLSEIIANTQDPSERKILILKVQEIQYKKDISSLELATKIYEKRHGNKPQSLNELVKNHIINSIGKDPWGGEYYIDSKTGLIKSTGKSDEQRKSNSN